MNCSNENLKLSETEALLKENQKCLKCKPSKLIKTRSKLKGYYSSHSYKNKN